MCLTCCRHVDMPGKRCLREEDSLLRASVFRHFAREVFCFTVGQLFFISFAYIFNSDMPCSTGISFAKVTFPGGLQLKRQGR